MKRDEKRPKKPASGDGELLEVLQERFERNMARHPGITWAKMRARLEANPAKLKPLAQMELTGGEPDVVAHDKKSGEFVFFGCSEQSPAGRTGLCYDRAALDSRKERKPRSRVMDMAAEMGVEVLAEARYFELQKLGGFDTRRSSWLRTPPEIRKLGGAESCYAARGFRGVLKV
jgi:hypothetical protein